MPIPSLPPTTGRETIPAVLASGPAQSLATVARASLDALFAAGGHHPSGEQWAAIDDLLDHLRRAAEGSLDRAVYVSAIPAGTGKTASIAAFALALMTSPDCAGIGMVITCNRVAEVRDMAEALAPHRDKLCVIVGKENTDVLALSAHAEADGAQVVISTQASLKETLKSAHDLDAAQRYHFRGARRPIVVWDEAIAFNRPVMLDGDTVANLSKAMRRQSSEAATALKEWAARLDRASEGQNDVPDFEALGVDFHRLEQDASDSDELVAQTKALAVISGGAGWVLRDNLSGPAMVSYVPELPRGLMPVIVTDASAALGVHHASYEQMASTLPVVRLKEASKTYRNMTLRIVPTAASRSTYRDRTSPRGKELIEMAVRYIRSVAPDDVLVVSYKSWMAMKGVEEHTIREAINARLLPEERDRVRHITWGTHTATNAHKTVRRVLLMGLNFLPRAASYAASGAALEKPMRTNDPSDHPTPDQVDEMRTGMLRDATMQAILRGNARMGVNGDCGHMEAVVPQVRQTGLSEADYLGMFPGVILTQDTTLLPAKPLKGKLKDLSEIVARRMAEGVEEMTNQSLYEEIGMKRQNFGPLVKRPEWRAWVTAVGLHPERLKGGDVGLRRRA